MKKILSFLFAVFILGTGCARSVAPIVPDGKGGSLEGVTEEAVEIIDPIEVIRANLLEQPEVDASSITITSAPFNNDIHAYLAYFHKKLVLVIGAHNRFVYLAQ